MWRQRHTSRPNQRVDEVRTLAAAYEEAEPELGGADLAHAILHRRLQRALLPLSVLLARRARGAHRLRSLVASEHDVCTVCHARLCKAARPQSRAMGAARAPRCPQAASDAPAASSAAVVASPSQPQAAAAATAACRRRRQQQRRAHALVLPGRPWCPPFDWQPSVVARGCTGLHGPNATERHFGQQRSIQRAQAWVQRRRRTSCAIEGVRESITHPQHHHLPARPSPASGRDFHACETIPRRRNSASAGAHLELGVRDHHLRARVALGHPSNARAGPRAACETLDRWVGRGTAGRGAVPPPGGLRSLRAP